MSIYTPKDLFAPSKAPEVYWMVHDIKNNNPTRTHNSASSAIQEAKRLSNKHPGVKFFVLQATRCFVVPTIEPKELTLKNPSEY